MDGAWLGRARWRLSGAWLWPAFILATVLDALVGHALPPTGESQTGFSAALVGGVLNLVGVILLARPLGALLRKRRKDLPAVVARNYAGTLVVAAATAGLATAGLVHHSVIRSHERAMRD